MKWTTEQKHFMHEHAADDLTHLLLSASRYPNLDIPFLVNQLAARRQIREKLPTWFAEEDLVFPSKIAAEQCSSEQTAMYKQRLVSPDDRLCDLTGGLGIDSFYFSRQVRIVYYIERFAEYCEAARNNFQTLGADNIVVINEDSVSYLPHLPAVSVFYIDPARRGEGNKRVYALADCEPDLPALLPKLLELAPRVLAKLSPMADIQQTLALLPGTVAIHILSVRNECKEVLMDIRRGGGEDTENGVQVHCVNFTSSGKEEIFSFSLEEERQAVLHFAPSVLSFLYEPNASVMKAGAFKTVALRFGVEKLHASSHLYTSAELKMDFPGRIFAVDAVYTFNNRLCKDIGKEIPKANIAVRNFPLSVDELRKKSKIKEGGEVFLFATTLSSGEKVWIRGHKI